MWPVIFIAAGLVLFAFLCRALLDSPRPDVETGLAWHLIRALAFLVHRLRVAGSEHLPNPARPGPLILVSNHTAGVDPLLIQAVCRFEIRWLMATDMRIKALDPFWNLARIIFVDRQGGDMMGTREAIRAVKAGGVLGIFPEGGLERPPRTILPFQAGIGLIIRRTGARVLPVVVTGTPQAEHAFESLFKRSNSLVTFHEPIDYAGKQWTAEKIASDLRARYAAWTGWPLNDLVPRETLPAQA